MTPVWLPDTVTTDLDRGIHFTLLWGLEGVVLRHVGGPSARVPFVNEEKLHRRLREAELPAVALDPGLFEGPSGARAAWLNDLVQLEEVAAFARRVGAPLVCTGALAADEFDEEAAAGALRQAGEVAARYGLRLAVRNDEACASGEALAALLARVAHAQVGAAWDPVAAMQAGAEPEAGLDALLGAGARPFAVLVRDGGYEDGGAWAEAVAGEGGVGWEHQLRTLAASGFDGPLVLDLGGWAHEAKRVGLAAATALVRLLRAATREAHGTQPAR